MLQRVTRVVVQPLLLAALLGLCPGCVADRTVGTWAPAPEAGAFDAGGRSLAGWGAWAAGLPVPACGAGERWVVDTTEATLEGGVTLSTREEAGPTLSLREALYLAANRPGPDVVEFDPAVFPDDAPGVIFLSADAAPLFPTQSEGLCLDGRGRGVVVAWDEALVESCFSCVFRVGAGSLLVGLQLLGLPAALPVSRGGQAAGCRFSAPVVAVHAAPEAVVGPGNAFGPGDRGVDLSDGLASDMLGPPEVFENAFGRDPVDGFDGGPRVGFWAQGAGVVRDNWVGSPVSYLSDQDSGGVVRGNHFVGALGATVGRGWTVGPGNVFGGGVDNLVSAGQRGNAFPRNAWRAPEAFLSQGEVAPITQASGTAAAGACLLDAGAPLVGTVELTGDVGPDRAFTRVAEGACEADGGWSLRYPALPPGTALRTLFTRAATQHTGPFSPPVVVP